MDKKEPNSLFRRDGINYLLPFILITVCFALWGFSNDVTTPMVKAFSKIFRMSTTEGAMVPVAYYLGYFVMAFPAALFIQRYSFKYGVLIGLALCAIGALLFVPAKVTGMFYPFLLAYFIMTCGQSFLETSCNPYIYCMGSEETATQRLNLAQAFNPMGVLAGSYVAMHYVLARLNPATSDKRELLNNEQFEVIKQHDLDILIQPYVYIGLFIIVLLILIAVTKMPKISSTTSKKPLRQSLHELIHHRNYREGIIAQFFYVGAQVMCWTFIIQYGTRIFVGEGMEEQAAEVMSQKYNIIALVFFTVFRFVCTWFLKYVAPGRLLTTLAVVAAACVVGVILFTDRNGLYCLIFISGCMSLMFPTIYGIALRGVGDSNVKVASAGLIMAILGGSVFPPLQAFIIDMGYTVLGLPATNVSFIVPLTCFIVIAIYGHRAFMRHAIYHDDRM
ncbi:MAG: L-fucose:H+ symporter permease [Prevotella sp.]|nr:L-fucose:H+ symporter permease [Prevotella sp.]